MAADRRPNRLARAFTALTAWPPGPLTRIWLGLLAVLLPVSVWSERGAAVGILAFLAYGWVFLPPALGREHPAGWHDRHPALDTALVVPLTFLALALSTDLSLATCALVGVACWAVALPLRLWRRRAG